MNPPPAPDPALPSTAPLSAESSGGERALAGRQAAMPFIMLAVLIDMVSIGLIVPVLPRLVGTFATTPGDQVSAYAIVAMSFALANFFGSPLLGALSDRYGRRPLLLLGFGGLAASFFVTALATQFWMLVAVRLASGAMQANAAVANAYVADISAPEERARRYGLMGAMFGVGFILGPVLGGLLGQHDLRLPFLVAGALSVCNGLYGFFVLPESLPVHRRQAFTWARANPMASLLHLLELEGIGALLFVIFLASLAQFILHTTWALYTQLKFGWEPAQIGASLFAVGAMSVLVQGVLVGRIQRWIPAERIVLLGLASAAMCCVGWGAATQGWMMYVMIFANVLGFAAGASLHALVANAAEATSQGRTMGAVAGLTSLAMVLAPAIGPLMLRAVADLPRSDWRFGAPLYLCALLQAAAAVMARVHFARRGRAGLAATAAPAAETAWP